MLCKSDPSGFKQMLPGVKLKNLAHGKATHMTVVHLSKGSSIPDHAHPHEQTGYLISGRLDFSIAGERVVAGPGDSWSIPGHVEHGVEVLEDTVVIEVFSPPREDYLA
jgi:quercetin dioxygenase-like cupin family protein